jgi:hypothetical protein
LVLLVPASFADRPPPTELQAERLSRRNSVAKRVMGHLVVRE